MGETADVVIVGAGVQGASLAFHLARRGTAVVVVERESVASGATGRSSGFVRMHYDLEIESRTAWASYPYFRDWDAIRAWARDLPGIAGDTILRLHGREVRPRQNPPPYPLSPLPAHLTPWIRSLQKSEKNSKRMLT